jgi:hypothetical protein
MAGLWVAAFAVDWGLRLSLGCRMAVLGGWLAGTAWGLRTFARPAWTARETLEDMALIVERRHRIDSDLIGALQFDSPRAEAWGSPQLSRAVIDRVSAMSDGLNVFEGFSYAPLPRRLAAVVATSLIAVGLSAAFPAHLLAFWNRFWLGSDRYPSRTVLTELSVNGQRVAIVGRKPSPPLRVPQGTPLQVRAVCSGEIPAAGIVRLASRVDRAETRFALQPERDGRSFIGEHPLPSDAVDLQVVLGDTWSDPVTIQVVPLPIVDVAWQVIPPRYARGAKEREPSAEARFLSVLEGSELKLAVRGTNKSLTQVALHVGEETVIPLVAAGSGPEAAWSLPSGTPLASVREEFRYEIHAVDEDGLSLSPSISGAVRLQADRPPRVAAAVVTKRIVPTARPRLAFGAVDDYGLRQVRVKIDVVRENGEGHSRTQVLREIAADPPPLSVRDEIRLDLSGDNLHKGDEVRLTVEAVDQRGGLTPNIGTGEPLLLRVTDRSGILAGLQEADQLSVKQLETIIQRELGIGGDPR